MTGAPLLPYGRQLIEEDDIAAVISVLRSDWLTTGPAIGCFEKALSEVVCSPHAVACANGTAALHLAMLALGICQGDRVVVPAITFMACANAVRYCGGQVVFADVDPATGLMTLATFREALALAGGPVRAAVPVHLNGQPVDMAALADIARPAAITLIEDACHALGSRFADGTPVGGGRHGTMACFSFHPTKAIAAGEGGAVTTSDDGLADRLRLLVNHGIERRPSHWIDRTQGIDQVGLANPWYHEQQVLGYNYRLSDIHAALVTSQLGKLERFLEYRRQLVAFYDQAFSGNPFVRSVARVPASVVGWHLYAVQVDFPRAGWTRGQLMRALAERGIGTQVHYIPVPRQPVHREGNGGRAFPGADAYSDAQLSLPLHVSMTIEDARRVADNLLGLLATPMKAQA